jgi:hypothetical protein
MRRWSAARRPRPTRKFVDAAGADAPPGDNGCVYPSNVQTVFNQLDAANKTWKLYSQDVDYTAQAGQNAGIADCGAPESTVQAPLTAGTSRAVNTNDGSANATSQYIGYHNPLGWFESMLPASMGGTGGNDCANNLEPLFGPNDKLYSDLQNVSSTPDFSFIVPNNCNNGHDAICKANNLSGESAGYPAYNTSSTIPAAAASNASTGGTYAESMFLGVVIPEIEASPAFKQNGLIVVTYDEAYPAATYSNDSQNDASLELPDAAGVLQTDAAGETLYGRSVNWEPTGPNATLVTAPSGQIVSPGPGDGANLSRPATSDGALIACSEPGQTADNWVTFTTPTGSNGVCLPGFQNNENRPATQTTPSLTIAAGSNSVPDTSATAAIQGDEVTSWSAGTPTLMDNGTAYSGSVYVGSVTATPATSGTSAWTGGFSLVDQNGSPVTVVGGYSGTLTVSTEGDVGTNPFYDAFDPTYGGGDTGAVLISPDITPGTVSNTDYNHYSLLRSIEDIFGLGGDPSGADENSPLYGVDGTGYLGAASQPGLAPFGTDVFTNASQATTTPTVTTTVTNTVTSTVSNTVTNTNTVTNNNTVPGPTDTLTKTVSTPGPTNTVLTPSPTQTVTRTSKVKEVYAVVPLLSGATLAQAKKAISTHGLKLGKVDGSGSVASMSPKAGTKVKTGTKVSLRLKK